jgi:hypothetical protein
VVIKYPTGLYKAILPVEPSDRGNVTFTISNSAPPRTNLIFPKIPLGIVEKKRDVTPMPVVDRRQHLGQLVFSVSKARRKELGNASRQYQIGQLIEFTEPLADIVDPMLVGEVMETRHDTNVLDTDAMGINDADLQEMNAASLRTQKALTDRLNFLKRARADADTTINVRQKTINEIDKALSALEVITTTDADSDVAPIVSKLTERKRKATEERDAAIRAANQYASEASRIADDLRTVAVVVQ